MEMKDEGIFLKTDPEIILSMIYGFETPSDLDVKLIDVNWWIKKQRGVGMTNGKVEGILWNSLPIQKINQVGAYSCIKSLYELSIGFKCPLHIGVLFKVISINICDK